MLDGLGMDWQIQWFSDFMDGGFELYPDPFFSDDLESVMLVARNRCGEGGEGSSFWLNKTPVVGERDVVVADVKGCRKFCCLSGTFEPLDGVTVASVEHSFFVKFDDLPWLVKGLLAQCSLGFFCQNVGVDVQLSTLCNRHEP